MSIPRLYGKKNSIGATIALASLCGLGLFGSGGGYPFRSYAPAPPQTEPLTKDDEWHLRKAEEKRARKAARKLQNIKQ